MADLTKQEARELDRKRYMSMLSEQSFAHQYFQYARYKTREHDKIELTAGLIVGLVFALIFGSGSWLTTILIGLLAFGATLITIFLLHWVRAPSAFHRQAIGDLEKEHQRESGDKRREMIVERLEQLIKESPPVTPPWYAVHGAGEGLAEIGRIKGHRARILDFLEVHLPEGVKRFERQGTRALEQLLAE